MADEFSLDHAADAVVDLAMQSVSPSMFRGDRDLLREALQDAVDKLIDECRDYYGKREG
jgi:hypothetical protein